MASELGQEKGVHFRLDGRGAHRSCASLCAWGKVELRPVFLRPGAWPQGLADRPHAGRRAVMEELL